MRSHTLHAALQAFAEEAAGQLAEDTAHGAEIPFELVEEGPKRRTPLYCYRPLVDEFLRERQGALARLPAHAPAVRALAEHADRLPAYLKALAHKPSPDPQVSLHAFLGRLFAEQTEFALEPARFEKAYTQLEETLFAGRTDATVIVPVLGLDIASEEVVLGEGLSLRRLEHLPGAPPDAGAEADVVAVFRATVASDEPDPFVQAGRRFRRLLTALRLYDDGLIALGPVAWTRVDDGPWRSAVLGAGGPTRADGLTLLEVDEEDELRAFCNLIARRTPRAGELAWALARYEMGCERAAATDALTDILLALRALLEPDSGASALPERLAALCAVPQQRTALAARVAHAMSLERAIVAGTAPRTEAVDDLIEEVEGHLRALLRDVLCGHLDSDLRSLADRLIAEAEPVIS